MNLSTFTAVLSVLYKVSVIVCTYNGVLCLQSHASIDATILSCIKYKLVDKIFCGTKYKLTDSFTVWNQRKKPIVN